MGKSVSDYMKIAWNVFGKKVVNRMVSEKAASFVGDICSKYQVEVKYKEDLMFRIRNIVAYLVNCRLEGAPINNKYVSDQIKGPIAHSLANAAASSNDYDNMMADFVNWLDDEQLDDIEKCLIEIGHKEGADYIQLFREMFAEVRSKKCSEIADNSSEEHYDSYEIMPERQYDKGVSDYRRESEKDDEFINGLTSSINNKMLSVSNGKPGPAQMVEMTKFFIDKSAEVAKFVRSREPSELI